MKLSQATRKLALLDLFGWNATLPTPAWEQLPFKCSYPPDGRFIGRNVAFYDRRVLLTPEDVPAVYERLRIGSNTANEEVILYATQENINRGESYLYSHTVFNVMAYATLKRLVKTLSASGVGGVATNSTVGVFPIIFEKGFSGPPNPEAAGSYITRVTAYIEKASGIKESDTLEFGGATYTVDELITELRLVFLQLTKL